jgi:hypothetical protein
VGCPEPLNFEINRLTLDYPTRLPTAVFTKRERLKDKAKQTINRSG